MGSWPDVLSRLESSSCALNHDLRAIRDLLEGFRIALDLPNDIDGARGAYLIPVAGRCRPEEDAEGGAGRPVAKVPKLDHLLCVLLQCCLDRDREIDLIAPGIDPRLARQGAPA